MCGNIKGGINTKARKNPVAKPPGEMRGGGGAFPHDTATEGVAETGIGSKRLLLDPSSRPGSCAVQCKTYNTHKRGKPEKREIQKKMFPSILFLLMTGVLPMAINGIWMSCAEKKRFQAISR